jgi:hypothetical protein
LIKRHVYEIIFLSAGLFLFGGFCFKTIEIAKPSSSYFFNAPNHHPNSIRQFSVGKINTLQYSSTLPIVNITVSEDDFFGYDNGIYTLGHHWFNNEQRLKTQWWQHNANYKQRGKSWEKTCEIDFITDDKRIKNVQSTIKINGNNTRAYPQKSLRIKADKLLQNELFGATTSDWIILRNSGNDWDKTLFADAFMNSVSSNLNVITSKSVPISVYINEYYWGVYNARQRIDAAYLAKRYFCRKKDVFLYEFSGNVENGGKVAQEDVKKLKKALKKNNTEKLKSKIDVANFIDYIIIQTFFNNMDWPSNNVLFYKIDGRQTGFTFILKDLDFGMAYTSENAYVNNMFTAMKRSKNSLVSQLFFTLINDKEFKNQFINRVEDLLKSEFSTSVLLEKFDSFYATYKEEMPYQINRWRRPYTIDLWHQNVKNNRLFLEKRAEHFLIHINQL